MVRNYLISMLTTATFGCMASQAVAQGQPANEPKMLGPTAADAGCAGFCRCKGAALDSNGKSEVHGEERRQLRYAPNRRSKGGAREPYARPTGGERCARGGLVGDVEFRLEKPDYELAAKIMKGGKAPTTDNNIPSEAPSPPFIVGTDDRTRLTPSLWPGRPFGYLGQGCTFTMIGPSTALSAAHCFYNNGWIPTPSLTLAADTNNPTAPFGSFMADSLTLPGQWNSNEWDWDFAVLEFSPTRRPGDQSGWYGTEESTSGTQTMIGYPSDKPVPSQWIKRGTYTAFPGSRYEHNLDVIPGDSGACTFSANDRCTGIQSTQWRNSTRIWNEVRRWNRTTYDFFDTYGNWP